MSTRLAVFVTDSSVLGSVSAIERYGPNSIPCGAFRMEHISWRLCVTYESFVVAVAGYYLIGFYQFYQHGEWVPRTSLWWSLAYSWSVSVERKIDRISFVNRGGASNPGAAVTIRLIPALVLFFSQAIFVSPPHNFPYLNSHLALNQHRSPHLPSSHPLVFQPKPQSFLSPCPLSSSLDPSPSMASSLTQLSACVTRILSLTGFPKELKTRDIQTAFAEWESVGGGFKIKWIDDTSLLIVFQDATVGEFFSLPCIESAH